MSTPKHISPEEWDLIENWLDQNDVPANTQMLSDKLTQIPNISQKIEHVEKVREEIKDSIRRSKIKEFHKHISADQESSDIKSIAPIKSNSNRIWYVAAAVLVVFIGIYWMMGTSNTSEKIFAKNFKPDNGLPLRMNTTDASGFYEGMLDYKQENYSDAIAKWEALLKVKPENDTLNYFLGVTNLALGNGSKSLEYLQNQERFQQGIFKEDAAWYASLASIKEGKPEEAKTFLKNNSSIRNKKLLKELHK